MSHRCPNDLHHLLAYYGPTGWFCDNCAIPAIEEEPRVGSAP